MSRGLLGSTGEELVFMVIVGMRTDFLDVKLQVETRSFITALFECSQSDERTSQINSVWLRKRALYSVDMETRVWIHWALGKTP